MIKMTLILTLIFTLNLCVSAPGSAFGVIVKGEPLSELMTWDNIEREIAKCGIQYPEVLLLQIRLETGNLTSRICTELNNLCGMNYPQHRETTAISCDTSGFAIYENWQSCIEDYKHWQDYMYKGGDYMALISRIYATDVYYASKLGRLKTDKI